MFMEPDSESIKAKKERNVLPRNTLRSSGAENGFFADTSYKRLAAQRPGT